MSAAKGMWYQSESKLKMPRSRASLVVSPQCAKTRAITPNGDEPGAKRASGRRVPVAAGGPPPPAVAKASSGAGPPTAPPAGRNAFAETATSTEATTRVQS